MRLFLDANVLFSAALGSPRASVLIALRRTGKVGLATSAHAVEEARRNLVRKAPTSSPALPTIMAGIDIVPEPTAALVDWARTHGLDSNDGAILAAAVASRLDGLVTGDRRHFGPLFGQVLRGVRVMSLADAIASVMESARSGG